jgi:hypothetical protein
MPSLLPEAQVSVPASLAFAPVSRVINSQQKLHVFNASNATSVSTQNTQVMSIVVNSNDWLNAKSSYLRFKHKLTSSAVTSKVLTAKNSIASAFKRISILIDGRTVEDIRDYNIIHRMIMDTSIDNGNRSNWGQGYSDTITDRNQLTTTGSEVSSEKEYCLNVLSGILNSDKLIPLFGVPEIEIQVELNAADEACYNSTDTTDLDPTVTISNLAYCAELHMLPGSYNSLVLDAINQSGLDFMVPSFDIHTYTLTTADSYEISIANNSKSVKALYFMQRASDNINDVDADYSFIQDGLDTSQLRVGSDFYPLSAMHHTNGAQSFEELSKALQRDFFPGAKTEYNITRAEYITGKAYYGYDLEKFITSNATSGTNFSENEITLALTYSTAPAATGNRLYVFVHRDAVLRIGANFNIQYIF